MTWIVTDTAKPGAHLISDDNRQVIATVNGRANAEKMAAAPELYEALNEITQFCDDPTGSQQPETLGMGLSRLLVPARAVLAKVKGAA